jgi:hypothetical protein
MEQNNSTVDMLNGLSEIAEFMDDEDLTTALTFIAKAIVKPDIPFNIVSTEIVRLMLINQIEERKIFTIQQQNQLIVLLQHLNILSDSLLYLYRIETSN